MPIDPIAESITYRVLFKIAEQPTARAQDVKIIDGYTTFADIPKIIAVSLTGSQDTSMITILSAVMIKH
jgi:hypothetical protein